MIIKVVDDKASPLVGRTIAYNQKPTKVDEKYIDQIKAMVNKGRKILIQKDNEFIDSEEYFTDKDISENIADTTIEELLGILGEKFTLKEPQKELIGRKIRRVIQEYKASKYLIKHLFKYLSPEVLFLVGSGNYKKIAIEVCNELEIKTIEFQHGLISKYAINYNYPSTVHDKAKFFSDFLRSVIS